MKKLISFAILGAFSLCLLGCENMTKQDVGVLGGGAIGGLVGSQFGQGSEGKIAGAMVGTIAGAFIGGAIGHSMDQVDQMRMQKVMEKTPTNTTTKWRNPDTGSTYRVTPTKTYKQKYRGEDRDCRRYVMKAYIDGKEQNVHGKACRMDDGTWKTVS